MNRILSSITVILMTYAILALNFPEVFIPPKWKHKPTEQYNEVERRLDDIIKQQEATNSSLRKELIDVQTLLLEKLINNQMTSNAELTVELRLLRKELEKPVIFDSVQPEINLSPYTDSPPIK